MKYYLIVGEASGDLHASHLMAALKAEDAQAEFRFFGGDMMAAEGGTMVKHYRDLAYMGFIPVLMHLRTILTNMKRCKEDIVAWAPDVLILVDYPGFNLDIAKFIHANTVVPVYYYISPKIWAWKEHRIKNIKRDIDQLFSILPFEVDFFERKHGYPINYVGNPTMDEVTAFLAEDDSTADSFRRDNRLDQRPIIALLAGSRRQEIKDNLRRMVDAVAEYGDKRQIVLAGAPSIPEEYYRQWLDGAGVEVKILFGKTFQLLKHSETALVTSGTATLETALFNVPQIVCYYTACGKLVSLARKLFLKVPFVSLVNLIAGREVVSELVADGMEMDNLKREVALLVNDASYRQRIVDGYAEMRRKLGEAGAPCRAAQLMTELLRQRKGNAR